MSRLFPRLSFLISLAALFFLGLSLFILPSQNSLFDQAYLRSSPIEEIDFSLPSPAPYPIKIGLDEPVLTATGAAVLDRASGVFLWTKNPDKRLLPASTVKIMTALVSLEHYSSLDVLSVPPVSNEGQDMKLVPGELITVEALLYGLLVSSANDAASVLAQNYPGGEAEFVAAMNEKAAALSLKSSSFVNPTGLDNGKDESGEVVRSLTSARDLSRLADQALENNSFAKMVATKSLTLRDPQNKFFHPLYNLNQLLWNMDGVKGIKTGWTEDARECLVTFYEKEGRELVVVVLGSEDRFGETRRLLDWVFVNYQWQEIAV